MAPDRARLAPTKAPVRVRGRRMFQMIWSAVPPPGCHKLRTTSDAVMAAAPCMTDRKRPEAANMAKTISMSQRHPARSRRRKNLFMRNHSRID